MKRTSVLGLLLCVAVVFSGCAKSQVATNFNDLTLSDNGSANVVHVQASIKAVYFLGKMPLLHANIEGIPDEWSADNANIPALCYVLSTLAKTEGATKLIDLQTQANSSIVWLPIPFIFSIKTVTGSANGVK